MVVIYLYDPLQAKPILSTYTCRVIDTLTRSQALQQDISLTITLSGRIVIQEVDALDEPSILILLASHKGSIHIGS